MKKLLLFLCLGVLIVSCGDEESKKTSPEHKVDKQVEKTNEEAPKKQGFEPRIIKN